MDEQVRVYLPCPCQAICADSQVESRILAGMSQRDSASHYAQFLFQ